jgi:antitoxin component of MazEF toxin-antitoxin module
LRRYLFLKSLRVIRSDMNNIELEYTEAIKLILQSNGEFVVSIKKKRLLKDDQLHTGI